MALSDISLTAGMRSNLLSLQKTANLLDRTQDRLSTGKEVSSALDDPINFFAAQGHMNRASDLAARKDGMAEAIQAVKAADSGITGLTELLQQAKAIITAARSAGATERASLDDQFNAVRTQLADLAEDSIYKGTNLLGGNNLTVEFDEDGSNTLTITGFDAASTVGTITASSGSAVTITTASWDGSTTSGQFDTAVQEIDDALSLLRTESKGLSSNLSIVTTREEFTTNMINTLQKGADNLTLADMNEEGANMLMLQTRQALGTTALSLSSQAAQAVLRLF
jgi:flagellin-like hook-associated protein FlgL